MNYGKAFTIFSIAMLFSFSIKINGYYTFGYVHSSADNTTLVKIVNKGGAMKSLDHAKRLEKQNYGPLKEGSWPAACWDFYNNASCWPYATGISTDAAGMREVDNKLLKCIGTGENHAVGYKNQNNACN